MAQSMKVSRAPVIMRTESTRLSRRAGLARELGAEFTVDQRSHRISTATAGLLKLNISAHKI